MALDHRYVYKSVVSSKLLADTHKSNLKHSDVYPIENKITQIRIGYPFCFNEKSYPNKDCYMVDVKFASGEKSSEYLMVEELTELMRKVTGVTPSEHEYQSPWLTISDYGLMRVKPLEYLVSPKADIDKLIIQEEKQRNNEAKFTVPECISGDVYSFNNRSMMFIGTTFSYPFSHFEFHSPRTLHVFMDVLDRALTTFTTDEMRVMEIGEPTGSNPVIGEHLQELLTKSDYETYAYFLAREIKDTGDDWSMGNSNVNVIAGVAGFPANKKEFMKLKRSKPVLTVKQYYTDKELFLADLDKLK